MKKLFVFFIALFLGIAYSSKAQNINIHFGALSYVGGIGQNGISSTTLLGFPVGLSVQKSEKLAFDMEIIPVFRQQKLDMFLFQSGVLYSLSPNYAMGGKLAFESTGFYGFTPSIRRNFGLAKQHFFVEMLFPTRFGTTANSSDSEQVKWQYTALAFQLGINF